MPFLSINWAVASPLPESRLPPSPPLWHHPDLLVLGRAAPGLLLLLPARLHATARAERRPWRELADPRAASVPRGLGGAYRRARANLGHFSMNYAIVVLAVVFLSLLWHPVSLIVFLACMVAWLFLYFLRDEPLALCGRAVGEGAVLAVLSVLTLVLLLLTGATVNILTSLLVGVVIVLLHAVFHRPADSIDEEAGRYYTPVPPQPSY
uniref:PRA1 family protein n=1 Tax=Oryza rufipogon TaxID=4529 RepID=A0A0E0PIQ5_ORYRU